MFSGIVFIASSIETPERESKAAFLMCFCKGPNSGLADKSNALSGVRPALKLAEINLKASG